MNLPQVRIRSLKQRTAATKQFFKFFVLKSCLTKVKYYGKRFPQLEEHLGILVANLEAAMVAVDKTDKIIPFDR